MVLVGQMTCKGCKEFSVVWEMIREDSLKVPEQEAVGSISTLSGERLLE